MALVDQPFNLEYAHAVLNSELVLRQQAGKVFAEFDRDANGQIDRDELAALCEMLHTKLSLPMPSYVDLGRDIAKYDVSLTGGLDKDEFIGMFKHLLQASIAREQGNPSRRGSKASGSSSRRGSRASVSSQTARRTSLGGDSSIALEGNMQTHQLRRPSVPDEGVPLKSAFPNTFPLGPGSSAARIGASWARPREGSLEDIYRSIASDFCAGAYCDGAETVPQIPVESKYPSPALSLVMMRAPSVASEGAFRRGSFKMQLSGKRASVSLPGACEVGDEVLAPFYGDPTGRRYRALVKAFVEGSTGRAVSLSWLRPILGENSGEYVCGQGFDDTWYTVVPIETVTKVDPVVLGISHL